MKSSSLLAFSVSVLCLSIALPRLFVEASPDADDKDDEEKKAQEVETAPTAKVAVVDLSAVFEGYAKKGDAERDLKKKFVAAQSDLQKLKAEALIIARELALLTPGSPDHDAKKKELADIEKKGESLKTERMQALQAKMQELINGMKAEIIAELAHLARASPRRDAAPLRRAPATRRLA